MSDSRRKPMSELIKERAKEKYQQRFGKRKDISSSEINDVTHEAAVEVRREVREQESKK